ncbi:MAG: hypothetical protein FD180_2911 [Planctomycetota bacterium]|nr:MAG: hypothetical protein FD180_2911 [Planctomycetota bacterium]
MRAAAALVLVLALLARSEEPKDPSKDGPYPAGWHELSVPDDKEGATLAAAIYFPAMKAGEDAARADGGPWPVCVFSPGGPASSWQGYEDFGKRFASWGVVTVVVAFGDRPAEKRAPQLTVVRDWLAAQNGADEFDLKGKLDTNIFISAGHSRGGAAAILAAADAKKWAGAVTIGAALRELPKGYATPTFLIGAPEDKTLPALYDAQKKPRWLAVVAGMDHFMKPASARATVVAYSMAWLGARFLKIADFRSWTSGDRGKKDLKDGVLAGFKSEE